METRDLEKDLEICESTSLPAAIFAGIAAFGWPYAIKRAMQAEAEIDQLRNELNILQESRGCRGCQR